MTKPVPFFPLYAANFIASKPYRLMNLQERGLWITLYMEFWVNGSLPSDAKDLSKLLGFTTSEIEQSLSKLQFSFIEIVNGELVCEELEEYRQGYLDRREKQRLGGLVGAERKKAKKAIAQDYPKKEVKGIPVGQAIGSLSHINSNSINSNQITDKEVISQSHAEWIAAAFDENPNAIKDYKKESKGY